MQRRKHIPNLYWQPDHPMGARLRTFCQIIYKPQPNAVHDIDQVFSGARVGCGQDLHQTLIEYGGAAKVWITVQVDYEPVNLLANTVPFKQYLSVAPTLYLPPGRNSYRIRE